MKPISVSGGLCAPINQAYLPLVGDDIWPNRIVNLRGWRKFFSWDKDWGLHLRGGPSPKLRDMLPTFRVQRGGIRFQVPQ